MREIKFRAWDKEYKQFIQFNKMGFLEDGSLWYVQGVDENEKEINPPYFENQNDWELMQYTGIKDKNGVEIYVGDIVKHFNKKYEVVKHFNGKYVGKRNEFAELDIVIAYTSPECEVIGNIYENPDILEGLK